MNYENYIESQYREIVSDLNFEFVDLYNEISHQKLKEIFSTLHHILVVSFKTMNQRLPTGDNTAFFWADPSRALIKAIDISTGMQRSLKTSKYAFTIDPYYDELFRKCNGFLKSSGGSNLPPNMEKVELYYTVPIFRGQDIIIIDHTFDMKFADLKLIGEGSYAQVFKYKDKLYHKNFVLKRAKKDLNEKELIRFRREFDQLSEMNSPYIIEVYFFNDKSNEYIMEYMDMSLFEYIEKNNSKLTYSQRKNLALQVLKAFSYLESKKILHRDVNPKNLLIRQYDDVALVKVSDFGLVKIPESTLTSFQTEFKGFFNDPSLAVEGFDSYCNIHETYALTRVLFFIMTGRINFQRHLNGQIKDFIETGLSIDKSKRFQSISELSEAFRKIEKYD